jgi:protease IV
MPESSPEKETKNWVSKGLLGLCVLAIVLSWAAPRGTTSSHGVTAKETTSSGLGAAKVKRLLGQDHLLRVEVVGPISMEGGEDNGLFATESNALHARKALQAALNDDRVKGVLLRIDTPGGTVGMSQELNAAVKRLVAANKPVVVSMGDLAASGGYYTACAASKIVANPGTLTGSIGVILSTLNMKGLLVDKLGLKPVTIKSGKFKDILSPYRDSGKEEIALLQGMINTSYQQFLGAVLDGRLANIKDPAKKASMAATIKAVADGRIIVATDAMKVGLVDALGDETDAKAELVKLVQVAYPGVSKDIDLEDADDDHRLLDWLGVPTARLFAPKPASNWLSTLGGVSFSSRHPNQPLWMYE